MHALSCTGNIAMQCSWFVNYDAPIALHNYRFLQRLSSRDIIVPRIWKSRDCAAIVVSTVALEKITEPHVMAWRDSFYEISLRELLDDTAWENIPATLAEA
jgi:hypothetical protein